MPSNSLVINSSKGPFDEPTRAFILVDCSPQWSRLESLYIYIYIFVYKWKARNEIVGGKNEILYVFPLWPYITGINYSPSRRLVFFFFTSPFPFLFCFPYFSHFIRLPSQINIYYIYRVYCTYIYIYIYVYAK